MAVSIRWHQRAFTGLLARGAETTGSAAPGRAQARMPHVNGAHAPTSSARRTMRDAWAVHHACRRRRGAIRRALSHQAYLQGLPRPRPRPPSTKTVSVTVTNTNTTRDRGTHSTKTKSTHPSTTAHPHHYRHHSPPRITSQTSTTSPAREAMLWISQISHNWPPCRLATRPAPAPARVLVLGKGLAHIMVASTLWAVSP